jgi:hypothetical protein
MRCLAELLVAVANLTRHLRDAVEAALRRPVRSPDRADDARDHDEVREASVSAVDPRILVRGLVAWMRLEGVAPTKNRLVKFLYLADLQHARYKEGATATDWGWYVDKFGPFTVDGLNAIDAAVKDGALLMPPTPPIDDPVSGRAIFYDVPREERQAASDAMPPIFGRVRKWIKEYGDDLPALLRFVYGNTEPMEDANNGDYLDFSRARPLQEVKPIKSLPMRGKDERRFHDAVRRLSERYEKELAANEQSSDGPKDEAYYKDLPHEDAVHAREEVVIHFPTRRGSG